MVQDQMSQKLAGVKSRQKKQNSRKALWDDVNEDTKHQQMEMILAKNLGPDEDGWVDDDNDEMPLEHQDAEMKIVDGVALPPSAAAAVLVVIDRTASTAGSEAGDELDKIT